MYLALTTVAAQAFAQEGCSRVAAPLCVVLDQTYQDGHLLRLCHAQVQAYLEQTGLYLECLSRRYSEVNEYQETIVDRFNCGIAKQCDRDHTIE